MCGTLGNTAIVKMILTKNDKTFTVVAADPFGAGAPVQWS